MRKYLQYFLYLYICVGCALSHAGSYDDFIKAVELDHPATIQTLLARGLDPNTPNEKGIPAILLALQSHSFNAAMVLAKHPMTQVNVENSFGETPLMLSAINDQLELAALLIKRGTAVNKEGWAPLHYAAVRGHREMMRLLLNHDADIDSQAADGNTPLMMAAFLAPPLAVKMLLEEGANPTLVNRTNATALDIALSKDHQQSAFYIRAFIKAGDRQNPSKVKQR